MIRPIQINHHSFISYYQDKSVGGDKNRALQTVSTIISSSLGGQGANQVVTQAVSPYTAYVIGQYFKNNDSLNRKDGGNRAGEGSKSHLLAHDLLAAATSYATGQSPATITTATITTMGTEALAPKLSQYLYGTEKVADLNTEQKQTISNVLGTVGLVAGAVTAQATGADSISSVSAGQQVQGSVQNAVENNKTLAGGIYKNKLDYCSTQGISNENCLSYIRKQNLENLGTAIEDMAVLMSVYRGGKVPTKVRSMRSHNVDLTPKTVIPEDKFNYFFGRVTSGQHNTSRSKQNKEQLASIGIYDDAQGRKIIIDTIEQSVINPSNIISNEIKTVNGINYNLERRETLIVGPGGIRKLEISFEIESNGKRKLTTMILKGGSK